jgi:hypothetical protein
MADLNLLAVGASVVVAFAISTTWYAVLGNRMLELRGLDPTKGQDTPPAWKIAIEGVRSAVVALAIAWGTNKFALTDLPSALGLALVLWFAFPVVLLAGSVIWEDVSTSLAAIHSGDWLLKLLAVSAIVTLWR